MSAAEAEEWRAQNCLLESYPYEVCELAAAHLYLYERFNLDGAGLVATHIFDELVFRLWQSNRGGRQSANLMDVRMHFFNRTIFVYAEPPS